MCTQFKLSLVLHRRLRTCAWLSRSASACCRLRMWERLAWQPLLWRLWSWSAWRVCVNGGGEGEAGCEEEGAVGCCCTHTTFRGSRDLTSGMYIGRDWCTARVWCDWIRLSLCNFINRSSQEREQQPPTLPTLCSHRTTSRLAMSAFWQLEMSEGNYCALFMAVLLAFCHAAPCVSHSLCTGGKHVCVCDALLDVVSVHVLCVHVRGSFIWCLQQA